jgi:hypothetical protein
MGGSVLFEVGVLTLAPAALIVVLKASFWLLVQPVSLRR